VLLLTYEQHKKTSNTQSATVIDKFELASAASAAASRVLCRCASSGAHSSSTTCGLVLLRLVRSRRI